VSEAVEASSGRLGAAVRTRHRVGARSRTVSLENCGHVATVRSLFESALGLNVPSSALVAPLAILFRYSMESRSGGNDLRPYEKQFECAETGGVTSLPTTTCAQWLPGQFPEELQIDFRVANGAELRLRPIRCNDAEKLVAFHAHLSFDSIYRRYFSLHPVLSATEVKHFTQVDYVNRLALVIEDGDELVAVGRYDRYPEGTTAEVAFVVRDDYQHLGLGHRLLDALAAAAWERGITDFSAETLSSNRAMMSVFRHSGFPVTSSREYNEVSVRFPIDPRAIPARQPH